MEPDWDDLIRRVRADDWRAKEILYKESKTIVDRICARAFAKTPVSRDQVEGVMNYSIFKAWQAYTIGTHFPACLRIIFKRDMFDEIERQIKWLAFVDLSAADDNEDRNGGLATVANDHSMGLTVGECLKRLSKERRRAILLRAYGLKNAEISRRIQNHSIADLIYHARRELRDCLGLPKVTTNG